MKIKLFLLASFIYIALIFAFAWHLELGSYTLNISTYTFELPIMIWLVIPLFIYMILAVLHIAFHGFLRYLKFKHFFKDAAKFEAYTQDLLLEKDLKTTFQTKEFRSVAQLFKTIKTHEKNHLKNDANYAYNKLKNLNEIKDEFEEIAFNTLIEKASYEQIKNVKIPKKPSEVLTLIKRFKEGNLELSVAEYEVLLSHNILSEKDYLNAAKLSTKLLNPDAILGIFNKIKNEKSEALRAYLYLLAEFGLLDELREQIHNDDKKFNDFKAFLVLREKNIKIDLNQLIQ